MGYPVDESLLPQDVKWLARNKEDAVSSHRGLAMKEHCQAIGLLSLGKDGLPVRIEVDHVAIDGPQELQWDALK